MGKPYPIELRERVVAFAGGRQGRRPRQLILRSGWCG